MDINYIHNIGNINPELKSKIQKTLKAAKDIDLNPRNSTVFDDKSKNPFKVTEQKAQEIKTAEAKPTTASNEKITAKNDPITLPHHKNTNPKLSSESMPTPPQGTRKILGNNPLSNNDMRSPYTLNSQQLAITQYNPLSKIQTYWDKYEQIDANEKEIKDNELRFEKADEHKNPTKLTNEKIKEQKPLETGAKETRTEKVNRRRLEEEESKKADIDKVRIEVANAKKLEEDLAKTYEIIDKDIQFKRNEEREKALEQQSTRLEDERQETITKDINNRLDEFEQRDQEIQTKKIEEDIEIQNKTEIKNKEERFAKEEKLNTEINKDIDKNFDQLYSDHLNTKETEAKERAISIKENNEQSYNKIRKDNDIAYEKDQEKQDYLHKQEALKNEAISTENEIRRRIKTTNKEIALNEEIEKVYSKYATRIKENKDENFETLERTLQLGKQEALEATENKNKISAENEIYINNENRELQQYIETEKTEKYFNEDKIQKDEALKNTNLFEGELTSLKESSDMTKNEYFKRNTEQQIQDRSEDHINHEQMLKEREQANHEKNEKAIETRDKAAIDRYDDSQQRVRDERMRERAEENREEQRQKQADKEARNEEDQARENAKRKRQGI